MLNIDQIINDVLGKMVSHQDKEATMMRRKICSRFQIIGKLEWFKLEGQRGKIETSHQQWKYNKNVCFLNLAMN